MLTVVEDRYGGVEVGVRDGCDLEISGFVSELRAALATWVAAEKRGIWLTLPREVPIWMATNGTCMSP
jgi:hypothetical protein